MRSGEGWWPASTMRDATSHDITVTVTGVGGLARTEALPIGSHESERGADRHHRW